MAKKPTISVCMIVKNEEANLPRLLDSIKGLANEVVIVDTGSTDRTVEIAQERGANVYHFAWCDDFSAARNESLAHATKDYVLWLDGDDEVEKGEHEKIRAHLWKNPGSAVYLKLRSIDHDEETDAMQLRMFPNRKGVCFRGRIHEQAIFSIEEKRIPITWCEAIVVHHGYEGDGIAHTKLTRNRKIHEKEILDNPDNLHALFFLARTLRGLGEIREAIEAYGEFINRGGHQADVKDGVAYKVAILEMAQLLCTIEDYGDARSLLELGRSFHPNFALFGLHLGQLYLRLAEYEKAYEALIPLRHARFDMEAVPINVKKTVLGLHRSLGISSLFTRDHATAIEYLRMAAKDEPDNAENYHYLSLALERAGDVKGAIEACSAGLETASGDCLLKKRRFLLLLKKGDIEAALDEYKTLNGSSEDIEVLSGMLLVQSRKLDAAGIGRFYRLIETKLGLPCLPFPEGLKEVEAGLTARNEGRASELFGSAVSHLLKISA